MSRPSPIHDPVIREQVIKSMSLGLPDALIAKSLKVHRNTVGMWKKKKSFKAELAAKQLETLTPVVEKVAATRPLEFLERHPATRADWAPPANKQQITGGVEIIFKGFGLVEPQKVANLSACEEIEAIPHIVDEA